MTVSTTYEHAPTETVDVGGPRFAYRQLGSDAGVPVIFPAPPKPRSWTIGTPGSSMASPRSVG
jgi:hypothetical protein